MHEPLKDTSVFYMLCFSASQSTLRIGDFGENHYLWQEKCSCLTQIQFTTRINAGTIQSAYVCNGWKALKRIKFSNAWIEFWIVNRAKSEKKIHQLLTGLNRLLSCGQWWVKMGQHGNMARRQMRRCNEKRKYGNCGQWWIRILATWQAYRWPSRCYRMKNSRDSVNCSLQIWYKFNAVLWDFPPKLFSILLAFIPVVCGANLSDCDVRRPPSSKLSHLTCAGIK